MFNKLISNLAFNPSTIDQVSFYAKRLKQEESIRRTGLVLIVFSMFIQIFAAIAPPEQSLAASNNDVIYGGVDSLSELKRKYNNHDDVKALYNRFGLEGKHLENGSGVKNQTFNFQNQGQQGTRTIGRINFASTKDHKLGPFAGTTFYSRSAAEWQGSTPAYYFGKHRGTDGNYYLVWVLKDCGNIAYRKTDGPEPPKPTAPRVPPPVAPVAAPPAPTPVAPPPQTPVAPPPPKINVCPNNPNLTSESPICKCPDNDKITADNPECITPYHAKEAINITQKLDSTQTVVNKAKPSDVIEYSLVVTNNNVVSRQNYVIEDYIGDILDYAVLDKAFLANQGGTFNEKTEVIRFERQTVPSKGQLRKTFQVKVKAVIPSTNTPNATATDYDCKMQNGFGNDTVVHVDCPVIKQVETLPNTGPGTTIAITFGVSVVSGYFYMRSRLLAKEVGIIKRAYQSGY